MAAESPPELYSVWLSGVGLQTKYQPLIDKLAKEYGTKTFSPHVTLVSGLHEMTPATVAKTKQFAEAHAAVNTNVVRVQKGNLFTQCVYGLCDSNPRLSHLNHTAQELFFPGVPHVAFMPHVSFVYGDLDADQRDQIVSASSSQTGPVLLDTVEVWKTTTVEDASTWECLHSFPLSGAGDMSDSTGEHDGSYPPEPAKRDRGRAGGANDSPSPAARPVGLSEDPVVDPDDSASESRCSGRGSCWSWCCW